MPYKKVTTHSIQEMFNRSEKIAMLTCYEYTMARLLDQSGIDVLLVGDSASNVILGNETTLPITLDQMIYHAQAVVRGTTRALVVVDLPFGSYQGGAKHALHAGIRIMKESGAHAVKLEGGHDVAESISTLTRAGIPVMGHIGLTPQSIYQFGSYKVRATDEKEARALLRDAQSLAEAGCFAIVAEKIPMDLAKELQETLSIPVIGIGAGPHVAGQVLVLHDALGLTEEFSPRFIKRYANLAETVRKSVSSYCREVKQGEFPTSEHSYEK